MESMHPAMMEFELAPYLGAFPITFDMSPEDVERAIGPPVKIGTNDLGEREEFRGAVIVRYSTTDSKVMEIGFLPSSQLIYRGYDFFGESEVLNYIVKMDPPYEFVGFLIFLKLGITMTGFHDNDESQKAITVFRMGRWDIFRTNLIPFTFHE